MHNPTPRIELGIQLRNIASSALDVSDGLLGDLHHILKQSQVDAEIYLGQLPKSDTLQKQDLQIQNQFAACGGDDYEICFTASASQRDKIQAISKTIRLPLTIIGKTVPKNVVVCLRQIILRAFLRSFLVIIVCHSAYIIVIFS